MRLRIDTSLQRVGGRGLIYDRRAMQRVFALFTLTMTVACSQPAPVSQPAPSAQPAEAVALTQRCTNTQYGFSVSYPAGWHTNDGSVLPACSAFDPEPIQMPRESEVPFEISVLISAQDVPFEPTVKSSQWERVLTSEPLRIGGRNAVRAEVEATGEGLADRGMRSLRYVIDLGSGRTLIATTNATGDTYAEEKDILARMVESLSFP